MFKISKFNGLNSYQLKVIAIIAMVFDHIPHIFTNNIFDPIIWIPLHIIGRIAAPLFFYFVAVGYRHSSNVKKYLLRLFIFALISQIPYILFFRTDQLYDLPHVLVSMFMLLNIIFAMFFSLLTLYGIYDVKNIFLKMIIIVISIIGCSFTSYGLFSIVFVLLFDLTYRLNANKKQFTIGYFAMTLLILQGNVLPHLSDISLDTLIPIIGDHIFVLKLLIYPLAFFIPMILILLDNGKLGGNKHMKWFFYLFYPLHLIILYLIKSFFLIKGYA
jgi:hypothetical protein